MKGSSGKPRQKFSVHNYEQRKNFREQKSLPNKLNQSNKTDETEQTNNFFSPAHTARVFDAASYVARARDCFKSKKWVSE